MSQDRTAVTSRDVVGGRTGDPDRSSPGWIARLSAWSAVVVLLLAVTGLWIWDVGVLSSPLVAQHVAGPVERQVGEEWVDVAPREELEAGAVLRVRGEQGVLEFAGGHLRLASGTEVLLRDRETVEVDAGSVLLEVDDLVTATWEEVSATGRGTWRLDVADAPRVGVYTGGAAVRDEGGRERSLARLQQVSMTDGSVAAEVVPLRYVGTDPWDARLLADALAVDRFVSQLQQSLTVEYGQRPRRAAFYRSFGIDRAVVRGLLSSLGEGGAAQVRAPSRILTGLLVSQTLVDRADLAPGPAVGEVVELRDQGAAWGLILLRRDLGVDDLRAVVDGALDQRATSVGRDGDGRTGGGGDGGAAGRGGDGGSRRRGEDAGDGAAGDTDGAAGDTGGAAGDGDGTRSTSGTEEPTAGPGTPDGTSPPGTEEPSGEPEDDRGLLERTLDGLARTLDQLLPGEPVGAVDDTAGDLLFNGSSEPTGSGGTSGDPGGGGLLDGGG